MTTVFWSRLTSVTAFVDTPSRSIATTRATTSHHTDRLAQGDTTTPSKQSLPIPSQVNPLLRPPAIHKKLLGEGHTTSTSPATPSSLDKGKGRENDPETASSEDTDSSTTAFTDGILEAPPQSTRTRQHQGVTSLLHLSAKKQFKLPSTPSKPSPLSGNHNRYETPLGDIKPLKSLGLISSLNASNNPSSATFQDTREGTKIREGSIKPKWSQLLEASNNANMRKDIHNTSMLSLQQDITELLSPRKKRKGWVPAGFAENASGIIKRLQTGNNLWIHEISRTLSSYSKSSSTIKKESTDGKAFGLLTKDIDVNVNRKSYQSLLRDLNPHLRLEILEILSPKPASLTWSSHEGGFITAGAAEKLLITRCKIIRDEDTSSDFLSSQDFLSTQQYQSQREGSTSKDEESQEQYSPSSLFNKEWESQIEGMVIFSLTAHSRTSTGITMVRKEQSRPTREAADDTSTEAVERNPQNEDRLQSQLNFETKAQINKNSSRKYNVYLPASIADLHTQMRINDEIWAWEPWSVVDLVDSLSNPLKVPAVPHFGEENSFTGEEKSSEKALLISRFAVLL